MALNITYGNDIQLRLLVTRDSAPFPIDLATGIQVNVVSIYRRIPLEFQISDGAVYATVKELPIGTYGIEVKGLLNKFDWRTYADAAIVVTSATKAGDTSVTVASDAYDVTMEVSMYVGTLPLNNGGAYVDGTVAQKGYFYALDGSTYLALVGGATTVPSEASNEWALLARKGHDFSYSDFTPEQISALQKPATDALAEMNTLKTNVETSEATRVENEATRVTNESTRASNENGRVSDEATRVESEQTRATAEQARVTDENTRIDAETLRDTQDTQEGQRVTNEQQRTTDEAGRVTAENGRVSAETERASAETTRASAETTRVSNENTRISNEQARVTAEAGRQAALDGKLDKASVKQVIGTSTTDVMSQKAVTDELAKKQDTNLLASYTHTGNKEVYISSIDYTTNTLTSVGHGLINSTGPYDTLMLAINRNATIYPYNVMPFNSADLTSINGLFVINATADTFQLSTTAGGAAITLVNKAENDLTKWHFEYPTVRTITISGLLGKINAGVKTVIDGTIIQGYAQYIGAQAAAGMVYIKSSDGATPSFNYPVIYGRNDYPVPCFGGQIIHTDIYTANGHRKIFDIAVYGYGTALDKVAMTSKYINFVTPIVIADSSKSFVRLDGVTISNGTTIKVYSL